ncbi:MAG: response regulator [Acidobacteriota bacterium]
MSYTDCMTKTILLVDYEHKAVEEIRTFLQGEPFSVLTAHDGTQAADTYRHRMPDLVLTSALLPKLNGFELCRKITNGELGEVRPVLIYSGIYKAEKYRKEAILGCGAVDFLEKPLHKGQLLRAIQTILTELPQGLPVASTDARSSTSAQPQPGQSDIAIDADEPLDVEGLFEPATVPQASVDFTGLIVDDLDVAPAISGSVLALEEEREIEAAFDDFRIDLDHEVQMRDRQAAEEIETSLVLEGQNILDFEVPTAVSAAKVGSDDSQIIDLDLDGDSAATPVAATSVLASAAFPHDKDLSSEDEKVSSPTFLVPDTRKKDRLVWTILAVLIVLILVWIFKG